MAQNITGISDLLGPADLLAPTNAELDAFRIQAAAQQAMQQQQNATNQWFATAGLAAQGLAYSPPSAPLYTERALPSKVSHKIQSALDKLPMSLCAHIDRIEFWPNSFEAPMRFTVVFDNQHKISFDDVDAFPAEEHIARIALECP